MTGHQAQQKDGFIHRRGGRRTAALACLLLLPSLLVATASAAPSAYRVNAGGAELGAVDGGAVWSSDLKGAPSPYVNAAEIGDKTMSSGRTHNPPDASVPASVPQGLFATSRWDDPYGSDMQWSFPVPPGQYELRVFFAENYHGTQSVGARVFDMYAEGALVLDDYDVFADVGGYTPVMKSFIVAADDSLDVRFGPVVNSPSVKGFEILPAGDGVVLVDEVAEQTVTLTNLSSSEPITVSGLEGLDGSAFSVVSPQAPFTVPAGGTAEVVVRFAPTAEGATTADLSVVHDGESPALAVPLSGQGVAASSDALLSPSPTAVSFGSVVAGESVDRSLTLSNGSTSETISVTAFDGLSGTPFSVVSPQLPVSVPPAGSVAVTLRFTPSGDGSVSAGLSVIHDGDNSPVAVPLSGSGTTGTEPPAVSFSSSALSGTQRTQPTSLQFGPDGRLYVAHRDGIIQALTVERQATNDYDIVAAETINVVQQIPNHNDDGTSWGTVKRQVTGLLVTGTAQAPVLYVTSSDPRIGGGSSGEDKGLDTNSGVLSRVTRGTSGWQRLDLVRGLPRSEENHAPNGLQLDAATNTVYIAQGGNTNQGSPSFNFAGLSEVALSAAILSVDLDAIGASTYDLPTLQGTAEPFGGDDGLNQAIIEPGGPVQVYAPGFRNAYDLVLTEQGRMYAFDNGGNGGWGGPPADQSAGACTNAVSEPGLSAPDALHFIDGPGYYGGHPNPTRANRANTFGGLSPIPVGDDNPVECDYRAANGAESTGLLTINSSTNGIAEYRASNFGGALQGDLLAAAYKGSIWRIQLDSTGAAVTAAEELFSNFGKQPLDVIAQGDNDPFPGTVWAAVYGADFSGSIHVFEPSDYDGGSGPACTGADDPGLDEDADGFTNADELDNGTDPCSAASKPADGDGDGVSDLNDPDDDDDGLPDTTDPFAVDADNGLTTSLPVSHTWDNDGSSAGGILGLGFTGLMTNGVDDYGTLFDEGKMTAGGAAGVTTVEEVPAGDAHASLNDQQYAFQFGVDVASEQEPFTVRTRLGAPFAGITPSGEQSMGVYLGTGGQDDYIKLVAAANGGAGGVQRLTEVNGVVMDSVTVAEPLPGPGSMDLQLTVDPVTSTVQASYAVDDGMTVPVGDPVAVPSDWIDGPEALAVGIISTSRGGAPFPASWDSIDVVRESDPVPADGHAGLLTVTAGKSLKVSSYANGSFVLTNQSSGGARITSMTIDLRDAILPDLVFDPDGTAGDDVSKGFSVNSEGGTGVSNASGTYSSPHVGGGYDVLHVSFTDFDPGENMTFSIDIDPTSIKGAAQPGPNDSGSVSGAEMTGALVALGFDDGRRIEGRVFREAGSNGGGIAAIRDELGDAPTVELVGVAAPAVVSSATHTARVTGPAGASVRLLRLEGGLFVAGVPDGGYDLDPFEANTAIALGEGSATIGPDGTVDVPVTLTNQSPAAGNEAGINHLVAVVVDGATGVTSSPVILHYQP